MTLVMTKENGDTLTISGVRTFRVLARGGVVIYSLGGVATQSTRVVTVEVSE